MVRKFSIQRIVVYYLISVNIFYLLLYSIAPEYLVEGYPFINLFNFLTANLYGLIVAFSYRNYNAHKGYFYLFYFISLTITIKLIFIYVNDSYFAFAQGDSLDYHSLAKNMVALPFDSSLKLLYNTYGPDDWGFPIVLYSLYSIAESAFALTFFNILCVFLIFKMVRSMSLKFMSEKAAILAALTISCSQYMLFYSARGLKEIVMVTIIIASFYYYYKYLHSKKNLFLFTSIVLGLVLVFFRIPLVLFILIAVIYNQISNSEAKYKNIMLILFMGMALIALWFVSDLMYRYVKLVQDVGEVQDAKFSHSSGFTYLVSLMSGLLGPLPTFAPISDDVNHSFYAGSLFLKVLLSPFFLIGIYQIVKNRNKYLVPILIFCVCEIFSLTYILESFEFRKSLPHIPFVTMIAVYVIDTWWIGKYSKALMKYGSIPGLIILVLLWNLLRL